MATTLAVSFLAQLAARYYSTQDLSQTAKLDFSFKEEDTLATGTGADKADQLYFDSATIVAGADLDVDLSGALTSVFGAAISGARVKALLVRNRSTNAGTIIGVGGGDGGDGTNAWDSWICSQAGGGAGDGSEYVKVPYGGALALWAPGATAFVLSGGSQDILRFKNLDGANAAVVEYAIVMASA